MRHLDEGSNPVDRVATAVECLPAFVTKVPHIHDGSNPFLYWTIRDYAEAYSTGHTTPTEVRLSSQLKKLHLRCEEEE